MPASNPCRAASMRGHEVGGRARCSAAVHTIHHPRAPAVVDVHSAPSRRPASTPYLPRPATQVGPQWKDPHRGVSTKVSKPTRYRARMKERLTVGWLRHPMATEKLPSSIDKTGRRETPRRDLRARGAHGTSKSQPKWKVSKNLWNWAGARARSRSH